MALEVVSPGQQVGHLGPKVTITGDQTTDNAALISGGFIAGRVMKADGAGTFSPFDGTVDGATKMPLGFLMNDVTNWAESLGPSGSKKLSIIRALPIVKLTSDAYVAAGTYTDGCALYVGTAGNIGKLTEVAPATGLKTVVGTCVHVPTVAEPWLTVAATI